MILITGIAVEGQPVKEYLDEQLISAGGPLGLAAAFFPLVFAAAVVPRGAALGFVFGLAGGVAALMAIVRDRERAARSSRKPSPYFSPTPSRGPDG